MKWKNRIAVAWKALMGVSEVADYGPWRLISLTYFEGKLIGLDGLGRLYELRVDYSGMMSISIIMENPIGYR